MFKIQYTNGNISNAFQTVESAVEWGKMTSYEFKIVDMDGIVVNHYVETEVADNGFVNIGGMCYDVVRRMGRE